MAYNPSILDTNIISRGARESKIDLATPVNMFTSLQANKRANQAAASTRKLSELTLSTAELKAQRQAKAQKILQASLNERGFIDSEKAIIGLNRERLFDEANEIEDRYFEGLKRQHEKLKNESQAALDDGLLKGKMSKAVIGAEDQVGAFMVAREEAAKYGLKLSKGLMEYVPTDEEIADGRLDHNVLTELKYLSEKAVTPPGPMSLEDKLLLQRELYDRKKDLVKTTGEIKADMPLTKAQILAAEVARRGANVQEKKLGLLENKEIRDAEKFEAEKVNIAKKARAYKKENMGAIEDIQEFIDRAESVAENPNLYGVYGAGRALSFIPGSDYADLETDIKKLVSAGVIDTMRELKAKSPNGSTGFGALSEKELMVLQNYFSTLGVWKQSPKNVKKELARVIKKMQKAVREERAFLKDQDNVLGPEKTEEETLRGKMKRKQ